MKIKNLLPGISICCLFILTAVSCSKSGINNNNNTGGTVGNTVDIRNMSFSPSSITVKVGITVKWTNNDNTIHTATSNDGTTFNSGNVAIGSSFSFTPTMAGTFPYHCSIHPGMTGTLVVTN